MEKALDLHPVSFNFCDFKMAGEAFFQKLCNELASLGIEPSKLQADHLCFRVESSSEYIAYRNWLRSFGELLTESIINGRPISTFRLRFPFVVDEKKIELLELPAPKQGVTYGTGFEHAEFVINDDFDSFASRFSHLSFSRPGRKVMNDEICLHTSVGVAKFHYASLDRVIEIENAIITDIVFDLDGTLIKSREQIYEINRLVFSEILERDVSLEESKANFHPEFARLFDAFDIGCSMKKQAAVSLWGEFAETFSYDVFDGMSELLHRLQSAGKYQLHLWTARDEKSARQILSTHDLERAFSTLSFATSSDSKPHGNSLKLNWGAASQNSILVVGDSPSDILGARNIGAIAGAALWDSHVDHRALVSSGAELYFSTPSSLDRWLIGPTHPITKEATCRTRSKSL